MARRRYHGSELSARLVARSWFYLLRVSVITPLRAQSRGATHAQARLLFVSSRS